MGKWDDLVGVGPILIRKLNYMTSFLTLIFYDSMNSWFFPLQERAHFRLQWWTNVGWAPGGSNGPWVLAWGGGALAGPLRVLIV